MFFPQQPFFIMASKNYLRYDMHIYGINYFYHTDYDNISKIAVPDGCTDLVFACNEKHPYAELHGTVLAPKIALDDKNTTYFGVSFETNFNYNFSEYISVPDLTNSGVPANILFNDDDILKRICETNDFIDQIRYFLTYYIPIYQNASEKDCKKNIVEYSVGKIIETSGRITEKEIALDTGYSERYLNKLFNEKMGINPKTFSKMIRFQSAIQNISRDYTLTLTDLAFKLGYYDQAHFIHDFKAFSGMTPKKYLKMVQTEELEKKIKLLKKAQN